MGSARTTETAGDDPLAFSESTVDAQYAALVRRILNEGVDKGDRTGTGTRSVFGHQMRFDLSEAFPLLGLKDTWFEGVKKELFWLLGLHQGISEEYAELPATNIKYLVDEGVSIWTDWPYRRYTDRYGHLTSLDGTPDGSPVDMERFEWGISHIDGFAAHWGDLGPVYGKQWRDWQPGGVDQIERAQRLLRERPDSRRIVVNSWNVTDLPRMQLSPCHTMFQFYSEPGEPRRLSCQLYIRSNDVFLGAPFNIASYALLTHIMAQATDHEVGDLVYTIGDAHLYSNHIEQSLEVLRRYDELEAVKPPQLSIDGTCESFDDWEPWEVDVLGYRPYDKIKAEVAV